MHGTAQRITGRITGAVVALVALGQVANLSIAAWSTYHGGVTSILHSSNATASLTAWSSPFPGPGGAAIVAAQAASILIALVLAFRARGAWQHVGHAILLGWILFWLYRIGHMAIVFGDGFTGDSRARACSPPSLRSRCGEPPQRRRRSPRSRERRAGESSACSWEPPGRSQVPSAGSPAPGSPAHRSWKSNPGSPDATPARPDAVSAHAGGEL